VEYSGFSVVFLEDFALFGHAGRAIAVAPKPASMHKCPALV
jgi:hypothetical protein